MDNVLGIDNLNKIREMEYYLFNIKYKLIDENFTFGSDNLFEVDFLERIHIFLFSDIYGVENAKIKAVVTDEIKNEINDRLKKIYNHILYSEFEPIREEFYKIWEHQIFFDGNTRTILCYLKILSKLFNFDMNYDFNEDVKEDFFISALVNSIGEKTEKKISK